MSFGPTNPGRLPTWIRSRKLQLEDLATVKKRLRKGGLSTVCEEARCPNRSECFSHHTATFLINGQICTRSCRYCSIASGRPEAIDPAEAERLVETVLDMDLRHVVITAVDRDDLPDGGASAFIHCIELLKKLDPKPAIEVLTPDFRGEMHQVDRIVEAGPDVFNHNIETTKRLYPMVRRSGRYEWALKVLKQVSETSETIIRKSGLMVGLGEEFEEVLEVLRDLRDNGCQVVTIGQYLRPTPQQVEVQRYWRPDEFDELALIGKEFGLEVLAGPFVRSSYHAEEAFLNVRNG